jgi:hypothetical protein
VAHNHEDASLLLSGASELVDREEIILDSVVSLGFGNLLKGVGLRPHRRLVRMTYPTAAPLLMTRNTAAAVGFEWG